jgi:hypothetical protein
MNGSQTAGDSWRWVAREGPGCGFGWGLTAGRTQQVVSLLDQLVNAMRPAPTVQADTPLLEVRDLGWLVDLLCLWLVWGISRGGYA